MTAPRSHPASCRGRATTSRIDATTPSHASALGIIRPRNKSHEKSVLPTAKKVAATSGLPWRTNAPSACAAAASGAFAPVAVASQSSPNVAGIETVPIHYRGGGPAMQDLVSGQVQVMLIQGGGAIAQHVKAGKLIALAVSTAERSKYYPGLPTIAETYPGFDSASWGAIFAPAQTPSWLSASGPERPSST